MQQQLSKKEIEDLLRRGAYGAIMDEEDEGAKFCEEDIDQILQRRTKTITIESEGRGSTFAKVSFLLSSFISYMFKSIDRNVFLHFLLWKQFTDNIHVKAAQIKIKMTFENEEIKTYR